MCNFIGLAVRRQCSDCQHNAKVGLLQNLSNLWKNRFHAVERVVRNRKLRNIHTAMNRQMTVAPFGYSDQHGPLAIFGLVILHKNDGELLVVDM